MEYSKISTSNWIAVISMGVVAVAFMIVEGILGHRDSIFALAAVCFTWASVFYFFQYFVAKRRHFGIMLGAILEMVGALIMIANFILVNLGVF
jgi:hypothetical protein